MAEGDNFFNLRRVDQTHSKKFNTKCTRYLVDITDIPPQANIPDAVNTLRQILHDITDEILHGVPDNDMVRLVITSDRDLDTPISIPFCLRQNFDIDRVLDVVERVAQSKRKWLLEGRFNITLYHVAMPQGGIVEFHLKKRGDYGINSFYQYLQSKKSIVTISNKNDRLCMARAICVAKVAAQYGRNHQLYKTVRRHEQGRGTRKTMTKQKLMAISLHKLAGIPQNKMATLEDADAFQDILAKESIKLNIFSFDHMNSFIYHGGHRDNQDFDTNIYIGLHKRHFSAILSLTGFFSRSYYCDKCNYAYNELTRHICQYTCKNCLRQPVCDIQEGYSLLCDNCNKTFTNQTCFETHQKNNVCNKNKICRTCNSYYIKRKKNDQVLPHICGTYFCKICSSYQKKTHQCFVQRLVPQNKSKHSGAKNNDIEIPNNSDLSDESDSDGDDIDPDLITTKQNDKELYPNEFSHIYFDLETSNVDGYFKPILAVAHKVCEKCEYEPIAGECINRCGKKSTYFSGENTLSDFCEWLFHPRHRGYVAISHNGGAFDIQFILSHLEERNIHQNIVTRDCRILLMEVKDYGIRFIDSLNFIKSKLSDMTQLMGLDSVGNKGRFPYDALQSKYYNYRGPKLPADLYCPGSMTAAERNEFFEWYNQLPSDYVFDFNEELLAYCEQDVTILRTACLKFRKIIITHSGVDPFAKSCTIAGLTTRIWRTRFMPEGSVGVIPEDKYSPSVNTSYKAIAYFEYEQKRTGQRIRHAGRGGEVTRAGYHIDGYNEVTGELYLFNGCFVHACPFCIGHLDIKHPWYKHMSFQEVYQKHLKMVHILKSEGYSILEIWEHEYDRKLKLDPEFKGFIQDLDVEKHKKLEPRDGLFGGRTECFRTHYEVTDAEKIQYVDIRSLYPRVLRDSKFPAKHPKIYSCVTDTLGKVTDYFGICKVKVLPPQDLWLPLLAYSSPKTGKLMFGLCRSCMESLQTTECTHKNINQRAFVGVYTTEELKKALSLGYKVIAFYQVWHYTDTLQYNANDNRHGIFSEYINTFYSLKLLASGFPKELQTRKQKENYIKEIESGDKIKLDIDKIENNPAIKSVAKSLTTNLWGRQAINLSRSKIEYFTEPDKFFKILRSPKFTVDDLRIINDEMIRVTVTPTEDFEPVNNQGSLILAIFCTSYGRLFLYDFLQILGDRVLYTDTDSIIYIQRPPSPEIPLGYLLGQFKSELSDPEDYIVTFVCCGLKSYGYLTKKNVTSCHLKGFTLDYNTCRHINLATMTDMVTQDQNKHIVTHYNRIRHDRSDMTKIKMVNEQKTFRFIFDKRILLCQGKTNPFGYKI